jgi:transposase
MVSDGVMQAAAPARLIEGGMPTEATIARVSVSKYADHLPLYRQAQIYARQGIDLDRSKSATSNANSGESRPDANVPASACAARPPADVGAQHSQPEAGSST